MLPGKAEDKPSAMDPRGFAVRAERVPLVNYCQRDGVMSTCLKLQSSLQQTCSPKCGDMRLLRVYFTIFSSRWLN